MRTTQMRKIDGKRRQDTMDPTGIKWTDILDLEFVSLLQSFRIIRVYVEKHCFLTETYAHNVTK